MDDLMRLVAIEEIKQLKARYFRYLDQQQWEEWRMLFTGDLVIDIPELFAPGLSRDDYVDGARVDLGAGLTIHHGYTPEITVIDDTSAEGIWAMEDLVFPSPSSGLTPFTGAGYYIERYRKDDGAWRISHLGIERLVKRELAHDQAADERAQVEALLYDYARAIDDRNFAQLAELFDPEATIDYGDFGRFEGREAIVQALRMVEGLKATQHLTASPLISLHGSTAISSVYLQAQHVLPDGELFTVGARYDDLIERGADGKWRFKLRKLREQWTNGRSPVSIG